MDERIIEAKGHFPVPYILQPDATVLARMSLLTSVISGPVDDEPDRTGVLPPQCIWMPERRLVILGMGLPLPKLLNEAGDIGSNVDLDVVIVRHENASPVLHHWTSFDARLALESRWRCQYLLWEDVGGQLWLIANAGRTGTLRIGAGGIVAVDHPPYYDHASMIAGLNRANAAFDALGRVR